MTDTHDIKATTDDVPMTRRRSLLRLGGFAAAAVGAGAWKALDDEKASAASSGPAGVATGALTCVLTPEQTEGPYYVDGPKVRRDIRGGRPGTRLMLRLRVVDASTCKPIKGAAVDIWHCDASGDYSGVGDQVGKMFLRGVQRTDATGTATFTTVYPGWYPGRCVHIHVKVHVGGNVVHTGQLYFPEATTAVVYKRSPYNRRPGPDVRNPSDAIFRNGGSKSLLKVSKDGTAYVGRVTMGVMRG